MVSRLAREERELNKFCVGKYVAWKYYDNLPSELKRRIEYVKENEIGNRILYLDHHHPFGFTTKQ